MDDLISKRSAKLALCKAVHKDKPIPCDNQTASCLWSGTRVCDYAREIDALPSVQTEIIRCKDCKFYGRADKRRFYRGSDCLNKRIDTIVPDRDFCSRAERKDEADE